MRRSVGGADTRARVGSGDAVTNPDPSKFYMQVAHGVKNGLDVDRLGAAAPDIEVPFCIKHQRWPCHECGTCHFEGCECPFCNPERPKKAAAPKLPKPRCLRCGAGPEWIEA